MAGGSKGTRFGTLVLYNCKKGCGPKSRKYCNKGVWPKKQVNKPLLKPATFCRTLCRGQNLGISPGPLGHCFQMVWRGPSQNCRSKRCRLGAPIPIWKWTELSESYGMCSLGLFVLLSSFVFLLPWLVWVTCNFTFAFTVCGRGILNYNKVYLAASLIAKLNVHRMCVLVM